MGVFVARSGFVVPETGQAIGYGRFPRRRAERNVFGVPGRIFGNALYAALANPGCEPVAEERGNAVVLCSKGLKCVGVDVSRAQRSVDIAGRVHAERGPAEGPTTERGEEVAGVFGAVTDLRDEERVPVWRVLA